MKDVWEKKNSGQVLFTLGFILFGFILVIWPKASVALLCRILGAVILVYGVMQIIFWLKNRYRDFQANAILLLSVFFTGIGAWILLEPEGIIPIFPVLLGLLLLVHAIKDLGQAIALRRLGYRSWWLALVFGLVSLLFGVILLLNPFTVVYMLARVGGVFLLLAGISDFWLLEKH